MKTSGDEFFYAVPGLIVPKNDVQDLLYQDLAFWVDWVQNNTNGLHYLFENHHELFILEMRMVSKMLGCIYARWLMQDASKLVMLAEAGKDALCRKLLEPFLTATQTLAIDIQMAQNGKGADVDAAQNNEIVNCKDIVNSMRIVLELFEHSDFAKTFELASSIIKLQDHSFADPLLADMAGKDSSRIKELASGVLSTYNGKLHSIGNADNAAASSLKKLLIVDDMPEVLNVLSQMLKDHYQIFAFQDARQALAFIDKKNRPDAFVLDIEMPNMDGFELAKRIRERPPYERTPIIFLTGNSARSTVERSLAYGAKAFFVKPASKDIILAKLKDCLR